MEKLGGSAPCAFRASTFRASKLSAICCLSVCYQLSACLVSFYTLSPACRIHAICYIYVYSLLVCYLMSVCCMYVFCLLACYLVGPHLVGFLYVVCMSSACHLQSVSSLSVDWLSSLCLLSACCISVGFLLSAVCLNSQLSIFLLFICFLSVVYLLFVYTL